jgi:hypothetical protein
VCVYVCVCANVLCVNARVYGFASHTVSIVACPSRPRWQTGDQVHVECVALRQQYHDVAYRYKVLVEFAQRLHAECRARLGRSDLYWPNDRVPDALSAIDSATLTTKTATSVAAAEWQTNGPLLLAEKDKLIAIEVCFLHTLPLR